MAKSKNKKRTKKRTSLTPAPRSAQTLALPRAETSHLTQARTHWLFNEWNQLTQVQLQEVEQQPQREQLALLIASAHQQQGEMTTAQTWAKQALAWGASRSAVAQVLVSGLHHTLGRVAILQEDGQKAQRHFSESISVMQLQDTDTGTLAKFRMHDQIQLLKENINNSAYNESLTREDVKQAFRYILNREPENEKTILSHAQLASKEKLGETLIESAEFTEKYNKYHRKKTYKHTEVNLSEQRVIFMHLPKTGGSTIHKLLEKHFHSSEICPERWNYLREYQLGELSQYRLFSGHFDYTSCQMIPGLNNKVITMLREPKSRLISLYYFQRAHKAEVIKREKLRLAELANQHTILDFFKLEEVQQHTSISNAMVNALIGTSQLGRWEHAAEVERKHQDIECMTYNQKFTLAKKNLLNLNEFGIMEHFNESVNKIFKKINIEAPSSISWENKLNKVMHTNSGLKEVTKEPMTEELNEILSKLTSLDHQLYEFALNKFKKNLT